VHFISIGNHGSFIAKCNNYYHQLKLGTALTPISAIKNMQSFALLFIEGSTTVVAEDSFRIVISAIKEGRGHFAKSFYYCPSNQ